MNTDSFCNGYESENRIPRFGVAATGKVVIHILYIHIHFNRQAFELRLIYILRMFTRSSRFFVLFQKYFAETEDVLFSRSERLVHIRHRLIAEFERHTGYIPFVILQFPVLKPAFDEFFSFSGRLVLDLFERLTDLVLGLGRSYKGQPVSVRMLVRRG